ncbi:MAG TPA: sodium:solute symporter family protein [Sedimentisphaerales bacterium]|nr:sodium:solute symporter family protein [Sedimentisphaerales bacterium]HNU28935.1 sodium:solute symporter family protein [Sedimentisphaerales bacterium]
MVLSTVFVVGYVIALIVVAARARTAREYEDFSVARRALPLSLIFGSLCATYVGPAFSIGFVGRGYRSGLLFLLIGLAYSLQNILVGWLVAPRLRELKDCCTLGDVFGQKYGPQCQVLAGIISVLVCTLFSAVMISAGGVVLNDIFGLPRWLSVTVVAIVTTSYTAFGGLRASVITDAYHFALFALLLPGILLYELLFHLDGGLTAFYQHAVAATTHGFETTPLLEIVGFVTAFFLGETLIPPYANLALASRTTVVSRNGFVLAGLFSALWFTVMIALGIVAQPFVPAGTGEDYVLLTLVKATMPHAAYALLLVSLVSVVLSSLDSLLNAGAVVFTQDILRRFTARQDSAALIAGRYSTVAIAAVAAGMAAFVPSVIEGLLICYKIWAPAILPALILGLWLRRPRPLAGILSMIVGTVVPILLQLEMIFPTDVGAVLPALVCSLAAYAVGHGLQGLFRGGSNP